MVNNRKRKVQKAETLKLIRLYRANNCLWNPSSSSYMNALKKEKAWQLIANFLNQGLTVDQIKQQIALLRYIFTTELLTIKRRKIEGYDYIPHFEYFNEMMFLKDAIMSSVNVKAIEIQNIKSRLQFLKKSISKFESEAQDLINYIVENSFLLSCSDDSVDHMLASFESNVGSIRNTWLQSLNKADHFEATSTYSSSNINFQNRMRSGEDNRYAAGKPIDYHSESDYSFESPSTIVNYSGSDYTTFNEILPSLKGGATCDPSLSQITYTESETAKQYAPIRKVLTGKYRIKPKVQDTDFDQRQRYKNNRTTDLNTKTDSGTSVAGPLISDEKSNCRYENCVRNDNRACCSRYPHVQPSYCSEINALDRQGEPGYDDRISENGNVANGQNKKSNDKMESQENISQPMKDSELPSPRPVGGAPAKELDRRFDNATTNFCDQNSCNRSLSRRGECENARYQSQSPTKQRSCDSEHVCHDKNNLPIRYQNVYSDHGRKLPREANNARYASNFQEVSCYRRSCPSCTERSPKRWVCTSKRERFNVPHVDNLILCPMRPEYEDEIMEAPANSIQANYDKSCNAEFPPYGYDDNNEYETDQTARQRRTIDDEYRYRGYEDVVSKLTEFDDVQHVRRTITPRKTPQDFEEEFAERQRRVVNAHDWQGRGSPKFGDIKSPKWCKCSQSTARSSTRSNNRNDFVSNYPLDQGMPDNTFTRRYGEHVPDQNISRRRDDEYNRRIGHRVNSWEYPQERQDEPREEREYEYFSCMPKCLGRKGNSANYRKSNNKYIPDYDPEVKSNEYNDEYACAVASCPRHQESCKRNNCNQFTKQEHGNARKNNGNIRDNPEDCCQCCEYHRPDERDGNNKSCDSNCPIKGRPAHNGSPSLTESSPKSKGGSADNLAANLFYKFNNTEEMMLDCECPTDDDEAARENVTNLPKPDPSRCEVAVETDIDMTLQERCSLPQNAEPKESKRNVKANVSDVDKKKKVEKRQPPVKPKPSMRSIKKPCACKSSQQKNKSKAVSRPGVKCEKFKQSIVLAAAKCGSNCNRRSKPEDDPAATKFQARSSDKVTDGPCNEVKKNEKRRSNVVTTKIFTFEVPSNYVERTIDIVKNHVMNDLTSKFDQPSSDVCLVSTKMTRSFENRMTSNPFIKIESHATNEEVVVLHPPVNGFRSSSRNSIIIHDNNPFHCQTQSLTFGQSKKCIHSSPANSK